MVLSDLNTYRQVIGCLMKKPLLMTEFQDIQATDFDVKVPRLLFVIVHNMFKSGATQLTPIEVDIEMENHEAAATIYKSERGLDFLKESYEVSKIENFEYYYKRLKKLSLLRTLKKNNYDISAYYQENFETMREEEEANERFENSSIDEILMSIESKYNQIKADFVNGGKHSGNAAAGLTDLVFELMKNPEIGPSLNGRYFSTACRGARLGKYYLRSAGSGTGKRLADYTPIPTPEGWKTVGDIKVGDYIFGKNGKPTQVLNVFKNEEQIWRMTFLDGRSVDCCGEHLWKYHVTYGETSIGNTKEIYERAQRLGGFRSTTGKNYFSVPMNDAVEYPEQEFEISPYEMGLRFCCGEALPKKYLLGSIKQRKELFRAFRDGKLSLDNECAREVVSELSHSLGWFYNGIAAVFQDVPSLAIESIEILDETTPMTCFTVDAEDALFQVGDFIITHNTRLSVFDACKIAFPIHYSHEKNCFVQDVDAEGNILEPQKTLIITTEMGKDEIQTIVLAYLSGVNESHILTGRYDIGEADRVLYASQIVEKYQEYFYIEEISDPNLTNIEATIKRYATIEGVQYVFNYGLCKTLPLYQWGSASC